MKNPHFALTTDKYKAYIISQLAQAAVHENLVNDFNKNKLFLDTFNTYGREAFIEKMNKDYARLFPK